MQEEIRAPETVSSVLSLDAAANSLNRVSAAAADSVSLLLLRRGLGLGLGRRRRR